MKTTFVKFGERLRGDCHLWEYMMAVDNPLYNAKKEIDEYLEHSGNHDSGNLDPNYYGDFLPFQP